MTKQKVLWMLITVTGLFFGCSQQQIESKPVCLAQADIESAMQQAELVLLKMNFVVEKSDSDVGIMRTRPLAGSQFFEFWKKDNQDDYNGAMSNLHTIQKTVELSFTSKNGQLCIDCVARVERLSIPEKEIDSAARAYGMFSASSETSQSLELAGKQLALMEWIDLGRDAKLETVILDEINKKLNTQR
ncbi:MAG: hypothetical protein JW806_07790 [Sedimentisphaerales bacterium]|nr:hypothetical protein [Sedimentisphaerales bacterium]